LHQSAPYTSGEHALMKPHYNLISYGKDGQPGGTGENADLTNH
jgi:Type II secretion system (T2SS), protein G